MPGTDHDGLFDRGKRVFGDAVTYAERTSALAAAEAREIAERSRRHLGRLILASYVAATGGLFVLVAAALSLGQLLGSAALGYLASGTVLLVGGGIFLRFAVRRLARLDPWLPVTRTEIRKDIQWFRDSKPDRANPESSA